MSPNQATRTSIKYLLLLVRYARAAARAAIQYMLALSEETFLVSKIASALDMKVRLIGFFFYIWLEDILYRMSQSLSLC